MNLTFSSSAYWLCDTQKCAMVLCECGDGVEGLRAGCEYDCTKFGESKGMCGWVMREDCGDEIGVGDVRRGLR